MTLSIETPSFLATVSMIRMLAWCMTTQSMSSALMSAWASASLSTLGTLVVANLYTSMPFIAIVS